ncbi:MAG: transglycosylase SLT domain-containing protein [Candidatus Sulfotelmatobacter sp.]
MASMPGSVRILHSVGRDGVNERKDVLTIQQLINDNLPIPLRPIQVDGVCGPSTIFAIEEIQRRNLHMHRPDGKVIPDGSTFLYLTGTAGPAGAAGGKKIAWGAKVSAAFKAKVIKISANLGVDPDFLMSAMAFESAETFSPSIKNAAGSGATGLIQFMPSTATALGTSTTALAAVTAEDQLDYVEKYFNPYKNKLSTIEDVYMAILWPSAIGQPNSYVLFSKPSAAYTQNAGLDANKDGDITKEEAAAQVKGKLTKGKGAGYFG